MACKKGSAPPRPIVYDFPQTSAMLDIGFQELIVLMVIALLVFGPYKLPELGRALGRAMREFRRASDEFRSTIETNLNINEETLFPSSPLEGASATAEEPTPAVEGAAPAGPEPVEIPAPSDPTPFGPADLEASAHGAPPSSEGSASPVEPFWAQRGGRLLHQSTCGWAGRIGDGDRVVFKAAAEAFEIGLARCPVCDPGDESPPG